MEKYISKSALVAEIERRQKIHFNDYHINGNNSPADYGACNALTQLLSFIDTLEVKEVDFEKEFDDYAKDILACDVQFEPFTHLYNCAKYFYELGLKALKGE